MYWDLKDNEGGFDFSNYERNKQINTDLKHKYKKTGTTIVGTIFKDTTRNCWKWPMPPRQQVLPRVSSSRA